MPTAFGPDENGGYYYREMTKAEQIISSLNLKRFYCASCERWHETCPIDCEMKHNDTHTYCKAYYAHKKLQENSEYHILSKDEIMEEEEEFFTNARWIAQLKSQWEFWLYQHPDSMKGDKTPAKNQSLKASAERWLQDGR